jgi:hypothetical protein
MKILDFIAHIITLIAAIASIANIDFPYRKTLLYMLLAYVLVVDLLILLIRKKV